MCTAMLGATPVKRWTWAASSVFSQGVRGTPGWPNTLNRVPVFPNAHEGSSISCSRRAALTPARSRIPFISSSRCPGFRVDESLCQLLLVQRLIDPIRSESEVELVDVGGGEGEGGTEQDGLVRADRERAEPARAERLALRAVDRARRVLHRRVRGQVPQVLRLPQDEGLDRAVRDVLLQRVRSAEPGQQDLAPVLGGIQDGRRGGDPDGGRGEESSQE